MSKHYVTAGSGLKPLSKMHKTEEMKKGFGSCPKASTICSRLEIFCKLLFTLSFVLCSASDSQYVSLSVESSPVLHGPQGGSLKKTTKHPDPSALCPDVLLMPCVVPKQEFT